MIIRSGNRIRRLKGAVIVNGSRDYRLRCAAINLGSYSGLTEADIEFPQALFGEMAPNLREAHVRITADGSAEEHFSGFISMESSFLDPRADGQYRLKAYTRAKWLDKIYIGQEAGQWEARYWVKHPQTRIPTGWTPALILQDIFDQLPAVDQQYLGLGDIRVLADVADLTTPDITFRLCTVREAIDQLMGLLGDIAFRERFYNDKVLLDFYRISEAIQTEGIVEVCNWERMSQSRANIQALSATDDGTAAITRVRGYGGYRQFMITARNYVEALPAISETEPLRQLEPDWDTDLEALVLKCPDLATGDGDTYSATASAAAAADATSVNCDVELGQIPPGSYIKVKSSGEILKVTAFTPAVEADPEADPPVEAVAAVVTFERAQKGTAAAEIKSADTLDITVPGIQYVFRRFRLPAILNGYTIARHGCLLDNAGEHYPQIQAFVYGAMRVEGEEIPEGGGDAVPIENGIIPGLLGASQVDQVKLDVERRRVTFGRPVVTLLKSKAGATGEDKEVTYQRTVCGVTLTVENRDFPFAYDTGTVDGVVNLDFAKDEGLSHHWQSNAYQFWCIGTAGLPIRGVEFPCLRFPIKKAVDSVSGVISETELDPQWAPAGSGIVVRNDLALIKIQCEQILRERCRRARSYQIKIPWFDSGYKVGQAVRIQGVDVPRDNYKITNITYDFPANGAHSTSLIVDNVKPPVRNRARIRMA